MRLFALLALAAAVTTSVALAAEVRLKTSDGVDLVGHEAGKGPKAVLLLHDAGRTSGDWGLIRTRLEDKGYRVLAIDLRGHGASQSLLDATEPDWSAMTHDVQAAVARLRKAGSRSVAIVGAGLGANLALAHAATDPDLHSVVLLSPGLNIKGIRPSQAIPMAKERPLLLAAAEGDSMSMNTVKYLNNQAAGKKRVVVLPGETRGAAMVVEHAALEDQIFAWLEGRFDEGASDASGVRLEAGKAEQVESTGKRFGD
jgi:pimeloyl-ACP methyl ester carboxylesterase